MAGSETDQPIQPLVGLRDRHARRPSPALTERVIAALALAGLLAMWLVALLPCAVWLAVSLLLRPGKTGADAIGANSPR